jgi:hypothetical protein
MLVVVEVVQLVVLVPAPVDLVAVDLVEIVPLVVVEPLILVVAAVDPVEIQMDQAAVDQVS